MHPYRTASNDGPLPKLPIEKVGKTVAACAGGLVVLAVVVAGGVRGMTRAQPAPPTARPVVPAYKVADLARWTDEAIEATRGYEIVITGVVREVHDTWVVLGGVTEVPYLECSLAVHGSVPPQETGARATFRARLLGKWLDTQVEADNCVFLQR